ncbi:hypothetical protein LXD69_13740 [Flavobacterium sediminilitoris]|uniref:Uncharacterized protein n=2 Tax=Flavobacterium TaxID=237 RepID=A0ABY4HKM9_9FLAO|nr:hypothetical protein [Flavobacterium sediminilitoris]UOX33095.1 hypothetical protein LXD69_13740 [Flavobacterium sediminilitoris]
MEKITDSEILQIHYYLSNNSHSMDAKILNKVEGELLKILEEVSNILGLEISVETFALEEGGIKSVYKFINKKKNRAKIIVVGSFLASIIGSVISDVISNSINTDSETEKKKNEFLDLQIKKLKQDFEKDSLEALKTNLKNEEEFVVTQELIDSLAIYISENNKVKISKSKFYTFLSKEGKIEKISTQELNENFEPKSIEKIVPRSDFNLFIVKETVVEPEYKENVTLEIVSPVLKRNRMSWKAIYNNQNITFKLKDDDFKNLILNKNLSFSNGTKLICDIETKQKMDDDGKIKESGRSVYNVSKIIYTNGDIVDLR